MVERRFMESRAHEMELSKKWNIFRPKEETSVEEYQVSKLDLLQACMTSEPYSRSRNVHLSLKMQHPAMLVSNPLHLHIREPDTKPEQWQLRSL